MGIETKGRRSLYTYSFEVELIKSSSVEGHPASARGERYARAPVYVRSLPSSREAASSGSALVACVHASRSSPIDSKEVSTATEAALYPSTAIANPSACAPEPRSLSLSQLAPSHSHHRLSWTGAFVRSKLQGVVR